MKILLTNDDGYNAPGIKMLQKQLAKVGEVYIVAPEKGMSAKSVSLTINVPLHIIEREKDVYSVDGYPADCVALAIDFFKNEKGIEFDLVVSGCNNGLNHSYDSIYSGTIGACLEALTYRKKTIAISCKLNDFDTVAENFDLMWKFITENNLISNEYLLNINFPRGEVKGIQLAREYYRKDDNYFTKTEEGYYAYRIVDDLSNAPKDSDCYLVEHQIISVVPLNRTYFSEKLLSKLKIWNNSYILITDIKKEKKLCH